MIKMIKGCLGLRQGKGIVTKTPADEAFSCDEDLEKRLVRDGFAEYVGDVVIDTNTNGDAGNNNNDDTNTVSELSYADLKAEVAKRGLTPASQKKEDLIAALIADNEKEEEETSDTSTNGDAGETTQIDLGNGTDGVE